MHLPVKVCVRVFFTSSYTLNVRESMSRFRRLTSNRQHHKGGLHQVATQSELHDILLLQKQFKNAKPRSLDNDILVDPVPDNE